MPPNSLVKRMALPYKLAKLKKIILAPPPCQILDTPLYITGFNRGMQIFFSEVYRSLMHVAKPHSVNGKGVQGYATPIKN